MRGLGGDGVDIAPSTHNKNFFFPIVSRGYPREAYGHRRAGTRTLVDVNIGFRKLKTFLYLLVTWGWCCT